MNIKGVLTGMLLCCFTYGAQCQPLAKFADSIRVAYHIPELCYAVVSSDSVIDMHVAGVRKAGSLLSATADDRFRIGSNTKGITSFIAAQLVKNGSIKWDTKFFDLFPELKRQSNKAYYNITLLQLLAMRVPFISYTYTYKKPARKDIETKSNLSDSLVRMNFVKWFLRSKPVNETRLLYYSNVSYAVACVMLERASGKTYPELVTELNNQLHAQFEFGNPNANDSLQTWGHGEENISEKPADNYKLRWLLAAGNINATLKDYATFVQLQLKGLQNKSDLLPSADFELLHFGKPVFALGWFCDTLKNGQRVSFNHGNPGTYLTQVFITQDIDRAYIIFTNAQNNDTKQGIDVLLEEMKKQYGL